jgi:mono/diheme cytochrome c family protein
VYEKNCVGCHQGSGKGVPGAFPPVVGSEWVTGSPETLARILLLRLQGPVRVAGASYEGAMTACNDVLKDEEIAAVATYLRQWAPNAAGGVRVSEVAALRAAHAARTAPWTEPELKAQEGRAPPPAGPGGATTGGRP